MHTHGHFLKLTVMLGFFRLRFAFVLLLCYLVSTLLAFVVSGLFSSALSQEMPFWLPIRQRQCQITKGNTQLCTNPSQQKSLHSSICRLVSGLMWAEWSSGNAALSDYFDHLLLKQATETHYKPAKTALPIVWQVAHWCSGHKNLCSSVASSLGRKLRRQVTWYSWWQSLSVQLIVASESTALHTKHLFLPAPGIHRRAWTSSNCIK